jgi:hypothetical protein
MKKILLYSILVIAITSCTKTERNIADSDKVGSKVMKQVFNADAEAVANITISSTTVAGKPAQVQISGEFTADGEAPLVSVEKLSINDQTIEADENNRYGKHYGHTSDEFKQGSSIFGSEVRFVITGYVNGDVTESIYAPGFIRGSLSQTPTAINRSFPLTLSWNADANNVAPVVILLIHRGMTATPDADKIDNTTVMLQGNDNGKFTIPVSELSKFPANSKLDIIISRGNQKVVTLDSGKDMNLTCYTSELLPCRIVK